MRVLPSKRSHYFLVGFGGHRYGVYYASPPKKKFSRVTEARNPTFNLVVRNEVVLEDFRNAGFGLERA